MKKKTPIRKEEERLAQLLVYMRKVCVPILGKEDTRLLVMLVMLGQLTPKGRLFVDGCVRKLKGRVDDSLTEFLNDYFRL